MRNKILLISGLLLILAAAASAHGRFPTSLVPCGTGLTPCSPCDIWHLADHIINFALFSLAGPILILALLIGGIIWMTSAGDPERIKLGKKILTSSIIGIFIAFGGWLIVDTILKTFATGDIAWSWDEVEYCPAPIVAPPPVTPPPITFPPGTFQTEAEARAYFKNLGFTDADLKPPCPAGQTQGCLNLAGLPRLVADYLGELKRRCVSSFRISGGTEGGHQTHRPGAPIVDITPTSRSLIFLKTCIDGSGLAVRAVCEAEGGQRIDACGTPANHIHVVFPY